MERSTPLTREQWVAFVAGRASQKPVPVWRPEVQPGEETQVDFGYMGLWADPRSGHRHRVWAFIFVP